MPAPPLKPKTMLTIAQLSPVVGGCVRTWVEDHPLTWRVDQPDVLGKLLGRGQVARTQVEERRFREVGFLSQETGALLVPGRMWNGGEASGATFQLERATLAQSFPEQWTEFSIWLREAVLSAAARGDFFVVEGGGWEHQPHPFALFICRPEDGKWVSCVEASPAPTNGSRPWPSPPPDPEGWTMKAPARAETLGAAASALTGAISEWAGSPLDVAVTYGVSPQGPFTPIGASAPAASPPADDDLRRKLVDLGAEPVIGDLLLRLQSRRPLVVDRSDSYLTVRPAGSGSVALYVHRRRMSIAFEPARAGRAESLVPGLVLQAKSAKTTYGVAAADVIGACTDALLDLAVEALDERSAP